MTKKLLVLGLTSCITSIYGQSDSVSVLPKVKSPSSVNLDSVLHNYFTFSKITHDSISKVNIPTFNQIPKDSLSKQIKKPKIVGDFSGQVGLGFQYGLLTGFIDSASTDPMKVAYTQGDLELTAFGIPILFSYNYASKQNPLGVNNYSRVSVNLEKYRLLNKLKTDQLKGKLDEQTNQLAKQKNELKGKLGYSEILQQRLRSEVQNRQEDLRNQAQQLKADTSQLRRNRFTDSLSYSGKRDSLQQVYETKRAQLEKYLMLYDSVQRTYTRLYDMYEATNGQLNSIAERKKNIGQFAGDQLFGFGSRWIQNVTKLDIGLTYPSTTALTNNSIPVKGIDLETQRGNWYTSVTAGVTLNNLMVTTDAIQNKLAYSKNLFNQFDFQNIRQKRMLFQTKAGWGTKEGTHFFLGMRYTNKAVLMNQAETDSNDVQPSVGMELDIRLKPSFLPQTTLDLVYGKTSDYRDFSEDKHLNPFQSMFSDSRTHTALAKLVQPVKKLKSELSASVRWIDPKADMASLGVLQPNNLRYELSSKHRLFSNLNMGLMYRFDRNNLDNQLDSTLQFRMIGGNLNGRVTNWFNYFGNLNFLVQESQSGQQLNRINENYTFSAGITSSYKIKSSDNAVSLLYSEYRLTTIYDDGLYRNYGLQHLSKYTKAQHSFSASVFETALRDSAKFSSFILGDEWSFNTNRAQFTLGVKASFSQKFGNDLGGKVVCKVSLAKHYQLLFQAEKFILGDFYNSFDPERFKRFPYAITTQLNYIIK